MLLMLIGSFCQQAYALPPRPITKGPALPAPTDLTKQMPLVAQNMPVNACGHSQHACVFIWQRVQGGHCQQMA